MPGKSSKVAKPKQIVPDVHVILTPLTYKTNVFHLQEKETVMKALQRLKIRHESHDISKVSYTTNAWSQMSCSLINYFKGMALLKISQNSFNTVYIKNENGKERGVKTLHTMLHRKAIPAQLHVSLSGELVFYQHSIYFSIPLFISSVEII